MPLSARQAWYAMSRIFLGDGRLVTRFEDIAFGAVEVGDIHGDSDDWQLSHPERYCEKR